MAAPPSFHCPSFRRYTPVLPLSLLPNSGTVCRSYCWHLFSFQPCHFLCFLRYAFFFVPTMPPFGLPYCGAFLLHRSFDHVALVRWGEQLERAEEMVTIQQVCVPWSYFYLFAIFFFVPRSYSHWRLQPVPNLHAQEATCGGCNTHATRTGCNLLRMHPVPTLRVQHVPILHPPPVPSPHTPLFQASTLFDAYTLHTVALQQLHCCSLCPHTPHTYPRVCKLFEAYALHTHTHVPAPLSLSLSLLSLSLLQIHSTHTYTHTRAYTLYTHEKLTRCTHTHSTHTHDKRTSAHTHYQCTQSAHCAYTHSSLHTLPAHTAHTHRPLSAHTHTQRPYRRTSTVQCTQAAQTVQSTQAGP